MHWVVSLTATKSARWQILRYSATGSSLACRMVEVCAYRRRAQTSHVFNRVALPRQVAEVGKLCAVGLAASVGLPSAVWRKRSKLKVLTEAGMDDGDQPLADVPYRMSALSEWLLSRADMKAMVARRRQNFTYCLEKMRLVPAAEPLFKDLASGQVPYSFPCVGRRPRPIVRSAADERFCSSRRLRRLTAAARG